MKTSKETFNGRDSFNASSGRGNGFEQILRDEIAQQVADALKNI